MYYEGSKMQERDEDRKRYNEQVPMPNTKSSPSILEGVCASLFNELNSQENFIQRIQSKLHAIANRSEPPMKGDKNDDLVRADKPNYDMEQQLQIQIKRIAYHNNLLEKIEKHLSEII